MEIKEIIQSINDLQGMLHELDREDRVFLSEETTDIIIDDLVGFNSDDIEDILVSGCKGYSNMTDLELVEEYKYTIREVDEDNASKVYEEVQSVIRQIISEQAEKALLEQ